MKMKKNYQYPNVGDLVYSKRSKRIGLVVYKKATKPQTETRDILHNIYEILWSDKDLSVSWEFMIQWEEIEVLNRVYVNQ